MRVGMHTRMNCFYPSQYALYLLIHFATAQFPDHFDFQKVEEINFNNEKFNVLKPTVHKITDHFEDFMRRENKHKGGRVFIDDNGFRHYWSGFGSKRSLRKTEISLYEINKQVKGDGGKEADLENVSNLLEDEFESSKTASKEKIYEKPILRQATTVKTAAAAAVKTTPKPAAAAVKTTPKPAAAAVKMTPKPAAAPASKTVKPAAASGGKTVAVTTFFCPFFGIIKMTSFLE